MTLVSGHWSLDTVTGHWSLDTGYGENSLTNLSYVPPEQRNRFPRATFGYFDWRYENPMVEVNGVSKAHRSREVLTAKDLSGQQNPSAEKTICALKSRNFEIITSSPSAKMTS